jgi:hypothetical protein
MDDLISRQDAIDAVYKCADIFAGDMPVMVVKADAYEALAQLPSAQPEQRWIPCKEKMPKELTRVLVCTDQGFVCIAYLKVNHKEKDRPWLIYGADPDIRGNVKKWMPLPETYKERRQDGEI